MQIIQSPSPNFYSRGGYGPEVIVVHVTDGLFPGDLNWLRNPKSQVSSHFLIAPDGTVHQLVAEANAAWHAGRVQNPTAPLKKNVNPNLYCVVVGTRILTRDLRWVPVETLRLGDKLIGFEDVSTKENRRHFSESFVTGNGIKNAEVFEVVLADGKSLFSTGEHKWLVFSEGEESFWVRTDEIQKTLNHSHRKRELYLSKYFDINFPIESFKAGYLSAAFDGEGCLHHKKGEVFQLTFAQKPNGMMEKVKDYLREYNFSFFENIAKPSGVHNIVITGTRQEIFRFLMLFRPPRLLEKFQQINLNDFLFTKTSLVPIIEIKKAGVKEIVTLGTSSETYIAEGYGAHNTVGIEVSMKATNLMIEAQLEALRSLVKDLCARYNIPIDRTRIWGHREIYSLKTCPGTINIDDLLKDLTPVVATREEIKKQIINLINKL